MGYWGDNRLKVYALLLLLALAVVFVLDRAGVIDLDRPSQNLPKTENPAQGRAAGGVQRW